MGCSHVPQAEQLEKGTQDSNPALPDAKALHMLSPMLISPRDYGSACYAPGTAFAHTS